MGDEYSDPIEKFKKPSSPSFVGSQFGGVDPRSPGMQQNHQVDSRQLQTQNNIPPNNPNAAGGQAPQLNQEQFKAQQQQQLMQQQQYLKHQAMMQHQQQQQMMQQQQNNSNKDKFQNIKERFGGLNFSNMLQELLILSILFIVYNNDFIKSLIAKIPGINLTSAGNYDTMGTILSAIIFSLLFILIRLII